MQKEYVRYIVSFSGGETSAFMCHYMLSKYPRHLLRFIFANTGAEREETLIFIDKCNKYLGLNLAWVEAKVSSVSGEGTKYTKVSFNSASRNYEPFEEVIKKYGIPNMAYPHCTRELKAQPIKAWVKDNIIGNYKMVIGIRFDESDRLPKKEIKKFMYPLANALIDKTDINLFWEDMPFRLNLEEHQGNCKVCWKKQILNWLRYMKKTLSFLIFQLIWKINMA